MGLCKSCGHSLGQEQLYCHQCGAKIVFERITIKRMFRDLIKLLTNIESPFVKTTSSLITSPKSITISYIKGKRKVITSPIRNAIIALSVYGLFQFLFQDFFNLIAEHSGLENFLGGLTEGLTDGRKDIVEIKEDTVVELKSFMQKHNQFTNFLVVPILAFICSLVFKSSKYNYAEHFSISLYGVSLSLILGVAIGCLFMFFDAESIMAEYQIMTFFGNMIIVIWVIWNSYGGKLYKAIAAFFISYFIFISVFSLTLFVLISK